MMMFNLDKEEGFVHLVPVLVLGLWGLLVVSSLIPVPRHYNDGKSAVAGVYIAKGGDDSSSGDSGSHDSGGSSGGSGGSGSSGSSGSSGGGATSGSSNTSSSESKGSTSNIQTTTVSKTVATSKPAIETERIETERETETRLPTRVETNTTPERVKSEIRQGNVRIKFEVENGKVKIETKVKEAENEVELEAEAENEAVKETEAELKKEDVRVATAPGQIALVNKRVGALSTFPLSVNPTTRQLTVTTPAGTKTVTVLPQKAIDNMLASHVMDDVTSEKVNNNLASIPDLVKLETKNGILGYQVKGTKTHKVLGFIPIKTDVEAFVSAENGQVIDSTTSILGRILNRIAP